MDLADLQDLVAAGESQSVEFKATTGQLSRSGKTLCGFLNAQGGTLLFGVSPDGRITGQFVSDSTLRDVASMIRGLEPEPHVTIHRIPLPGTGREVLALEAQTRSDLVPFAFEGRAYERLGTTVSVMPQRRYQDLLLRRTGHSRTTSLISSGWDSSVPVGTGKGLATGCSVGCPRSATGEV